MSKIAPADVAALNTPPPSTVSYILAVKLPASLPVSLSGSTAGFDTNSAVLYAFES